MTRYKGYVIKKSTKGGYDVYLRGQKVAHGSPLSGAKFWVDHYGEKSNPKREYSVGGHAVTRDEMAGMLKARRSSRAKRKNPSISKRTAAVQRKVASALAGFLKKVNPAMKTAGAKVQRLKGGVIKITPIKANAARKSQPFIWQVYNTKAEAAAQAKRYREASMRVKIVKTANGYEVRGLK